MTPPDHRLIARLAVAYADSMCDITGTADTPFDRHDIAVAYIQGGEKTLRRLCSVIVESARCGGLSDVQARKLLQTIETIENSQP